MIKLLPAIVFIFWVYLYSRNSLTKGTDDFTDKYEEKLIAEKLKKDYNFDVDIDRVKAKIKKRKIYFYYL